MNITKKDINWLSVVFAEMKDSPSTTIQVLVKAWSVYEQQKTNGLSHFLEHMFFKWWKCYKNAKEVSEALDLIGASCNAFTGDEYAGYWVKCAPVFLEKSIDILSDMLVNSTFPAEEIEKEKWVIIQEILMYKDMPHQDVWNKRKRWYYGDNPHGWPIIWSQENVLSFTQEDFLRHKKALYTKDNLVIVVAWAIPDHKALESMIAEYFNDLPISASIQAPVFSWPLPETNEAFDVVDTQQNHLVMGAEWRSMHEDERYAASMMSIILWWTMSSRLFQEIREKQGLCYYVWSSHDSTADSGTFYIYWGMEKERRWVALDSIYKEIASLVASWIRDEEYAKARLHIQWSLAMSIETSQKLAGYVAKQALFKNNIRMLDDVLDSYLSVSKEEINACTKKLATDNLYSYWIQ